MRRGFFINVVRIVETCLNLKNEKTTVIYLAFTKPCKEKSHLVYCIIIVKRDKFLESCKEKPPLVSGVILKALNYFVKTLNYFVKTLNYLLKALFCEYVVQIYRLAFYFIRNF